MNQILSCCKRDLLDIYRHALEAIKPEQLIKNCVQFKDGKILIENRTIPRTKSFEYELDNASIHVIGGGKCALAMAKGLSEVASKSKVTDLFSSGCLSVPINSREAFHKDVGAQTLIQNLGIILKFGSKDNLPDEDSVEATKTIFEKIHDANTEDKIRGSRSLFIVLISGGGSACLTYPRYIKLAQKSDLIKRLVQRGADIVELNNVRRCFSQVKGGNLARYILKSNPDAMVISLIMSDVINDPIDIIASGPTSLDTSEGTMQQSMKAVMRRYGVEVPTNTENAGSEICEASDRVLNLIIGNNSVALHSLSSRANQLGYDTFILGNNLSGPTTVLLDRILDSAKSKTGKFLIVGAGESTVSRGPGESWGIGGRVQEIALDYMIYKLAKDPDKKLVDLFLAGSTDGQDGPTDVAACLASFSDWSLAKNFGLHDLIEAKTNHNSNTFWMKNKPDWLVRTGPTGTNVMDLYMLMGVPGQ